jgi:hypothetical protein
MESQNSTSNNIHVNWRKASDENISLYKDQVIDNLGSLVGGSQSSDLASPSDVERFTNLFCSIIKNSAASCTC